MTRIATFLAALMLPFAPVQAAETGVTVFAAASLRGVLEEVAALSGHETRLSFGGSGTMARQVAAGAPSDLVILANDLWMDWLMDQRVSGMGPAKTIARNRLVLIAPKGTAPLDGPADIPARLGSERLAMGQRDAVPAGGYARQWLESAGIWAQISTRLAETDNVRAALTLVARGDVGFGIVYATDAKAEPKVTVLLQASEQDHSPIRYLAAALSPAGEAFLDHLTSKEAEAIFAAHGFQSVTP